MTAGILYFNLLLWFGSSTFSTEFTFVFCTADRTFPGLGASAFSAEFTAVDRTALRTFPVVRRPGGSAIRTEFSSVIIIRTAFALPCTRR